MRIERITEADLPQIASIHCRAFRGSAMSALGKGAVLRYYRWLLTGPHEGVCLAARSGSTIAGFCFAGRFRGALSGFLHRHRMYLALQVLLHPWVAFHPEVRTAIATAARMFSHPSNSAVKRKTMAPKFGILAIATDPGLQRSGAGRALMEACERIACERGHSLMDLTVRPDNTGAVKFYEAGGWKRVPGSDGPWRGYMIKDLTPLARAEAR